MFLTIALLAGAILRLSFVNDMEYKEDEQINFTQSQVAGSLLSSSPWPAVGMPSGVYLSNPGMSVWVFTLLARLSHASTPTALAHALQIFSILGIFLIIPFAFWLIKDLKEREVWLWACALAFVNPFAVFYERKLWPEPFLPFFIMLMLMAWWRRNKLLGAFFWGLIGAWLGQIHMSGFFMAFGLFLWTLLFERKIASSIRIRTNWLGWLGGSFLGALPLIPWFLYIREHPQPGQMFSGLNMLLQFKFWAFWISDPLGLHLGNPLGLLRGESNFAQLSDFIRYPLIAGHATYLCGFSHAAIVGIAGIAIMLVFRLCTNPLKLSLNNLLRNTNQTILARNAALWGFGLTLTLTTVNIRRYYLITSFPFEFIWLVQLFDISMTPRLRNKLLAALWVLELFISATFVGYIHVNEGSLQGDYGPAYHVQFKQ